MKRCLQRQIPWSYVREAPENKYFVLMVKVAGREGVRVDRKYGTGTENLTALFIKIYSPPMSTVSIFYYTKA
jgi:hypothetical protein